MTTIAKGYTYGVIAAGGGLMAAALLQWTSPHPGIWLAYLLVAAIASLVKMRLPGMNGTYSLSFLFLLYGILRFTLPETLVAGCIAALVGSLWNRGQKPVLTRILFNIGNLTLSVGVCYLPAYLAPSSHAGPYQLSAIALDTALYFVVNTVLVSGILSLLQNKPLSEVCEQWYVWSFPYYLVGAALVGLALAVPGSFRDGAFLVLLPLIYLVHFFVGLSELRMSSGGLRPTGSTLPPRARAYVLVTVVAGVSVLSCGLWKWESSDPLRLLAYLALGVMASTLKVRLPHMTGNISLNFVLLLVALVDLTLSETMLMGALVGVVQCLWKPKRPPMLIQVLFNSACLTCSTALAWLLGRWGAHASGLDTTVIGLLAVSTPILYFSNTLMVSTVLSLAQTGTLSAIWKNCCFWSLPYYLVGAVAAGLMEVSARAAGWQSSLLVFPLMGLVYVSYRIHVSQAADRQPIPV